MEVLGTLYNESIITIPSIKHSYIHATSLNKQFPFFKCDVY